ncbi:hypothetical protein P7C71_g4560, partial [Lecanoromycetidae sp. Uapishka_2]
MLLPRDLYSSPPAPKDKDQDNPTLLTSWWCTGFAVAIILHREIGSRLVLASRIMYALFLWIAKFTISEFLKRLTSHVWKRSYEFGLQCIRWFLVVTFLAVVIATLAECHPFNHYWQVIPDPGGKCRQGTAQLITMGASDIITDLLIVGFPIPIVIKSAMAIQRKISLVLLFALSLILVGITVYRVQGVIQRHYDQQFRSLLASLEILAAAAVSNALVLGSFVRDRGTKKQHFRFGSTGGQSSLDRSTTAPRRVITARAWGSDADLVGDLGMNLGPELHEKSSSLPRPAPIATPLRNEASAIPADPIDRTWAFPNRTSDETDETDLKSPEPVHELQPSPGEVSSTPKGMSFFDVGGLLGGNSDPRTSHRPSISASQRQYNALPSPHLQPSATTTPPAHSRRGSHALLQDIGGLLPLSPRTMAPQAAAPRPAPSTQNSDLIEALKSTPPNTARRQPAPPQRQRRGSPGLQDVGGLLS